jgi:predicted metalloprotease with PDZ domain
MVAGDDMPLEPRAVAAMLSVLLHVLIAAVFVRAATASTDAPRPKEHEATADKLRGAGDRVARIELRPGLAASGQACTGSSYVGVGVTADPRTERIILVGDDTPASRAGLQHDDIVLNPAVWHERHREGDVLAVHILREGVTLRLPVRIGKICID